MESILISYILPIFGLLMLLFCILSYFFPYGERFRGKIQKIKAFGMNFEVSILALFILIGLAFSCFGIYLFVNNYETQINGYEAKISKIEAKIAEAEKRDLVLLISLEGTNEENEPNFTDLQCYYSCPGLDQEVRADMSKGYIPDQYKIHLKDIKRTTFIVNLTIEDAANGKKWIKNNFAPFEPYYILELKD